MTLTLDKSEKPGSLFWFHAVMSLQFTHVPSFACIGRLRNLRADCSTIGLYCETITLQQIFKSSHQVVVLLVGVSQHVQLLNRDILAGVMQRDSDCW